MALGFKGAYDDVIPNDGISYDINALSTIPHHVAFDDVGAIYIGVRNAVRQDAWIVCVVYYIVSNDVAPGTVFDLNAIPLAATRIVYPVLLNDGVRDCTSGVVAANIHTFSGAGGIVDMVSSDDYRIHGATEVYAYVDIVNLVFFNSNVMRPTAHVDPVAVTSNLQMLNRHISRTLDIDRILRC